MNVVYYPDPILKQRAEPVEQFDDELRQLVEDMKLTMIRYGGVGLAAPQVGIAKRLLLVSEDGTYEKAFALINPVIKTSGELVTAQEGCLSFPDIYGDIDRPERVTVQARNEQGEEITLEDDGWVARIIQHEFDHLEGRLFVERLSPADKVRVKKAVLALRERWERANA
ncbi:MAG: peptide deformylase [Planctomycetes bacterium]|nr:peptide deformylase [Planctomycetota bacterium]